MKAVRILQMLFKGHKLLGTGVLFCLCCTRCILLWFRFTVLYRFLFSGVVPDSGVTGCFQESFTGPSHFNRIRVDILFRHIKCSVSFHERFSRRTVVHVAYGMLNNCAIILEKISPVKAYAYQ